MSEEKTPTPQGNVETTSIGNSDRETGSLTGSGEFRKGSNMLPDLQMGPLDAAPSPMASVPIEPAAGDTGSANDAPAHE
ncbi:MAG TPA: hypothetical protein VJ935_06870 [Acidimicrobiia bacterium]|nr:hypothetical protein [Acidimicrobiia bacterium]